MFKISISTISLIFIGLSLHCFSQNLSEIQRAAEKGDANAQYTLGEHYYTEEDLNKAAYWLEKAVKQGNIEAHALLGEMYLDEEIGNGTGADMEKGINLIIKAAEGEHSGAQYLLGDVYYGFYDYEYEGFEYENIKKALYWYKKAAENGNYFAQLELGQWYYYGNHVSKNIEKAISWLEKAARQDYEKAQFFLGYTYYKGVDYPKNLNKVHYWLEKAAERDEYAQYLLGHMYCYGEGVATNYQKSAFWFEKAAEQGNSFARFQLGRLLFQGIGIPKDLEKSVYWLKESDTESFDNIPSLYYLASIYRNNPGMTGIYKFSKENQEFLNRFNEKDLTDADCLLGLMLFNAKNCYFLWETIELCHEAFYWLEKAAEENNGLAQYFLIFYAKDYKEKLFYARQVLKNGIISSEVYEKTKEIIEERLRSQKKKKSGF